MLSTAITTTRPSSASAFQASPFTNSIRAASNHTNSFSNKFRLIPYCRYSLRPKPAGELFFKHPNAWINRLSIYSSSSSKPFSRPAIVMVSQDCTVKKEVDVPASVAYKIYSDREAMPRWMPFISSVKVLKDKPDLSRWTLKYKAFGQNIEFSWLARNLQPIPNQKIHWRSLEGLPNSGAVRFYPKGPSSCLIELTVSYEVPQILVPVSSALQPFLQSLLLRGLERFSNVAKSYQPDSTA